MNSALTQLEEWRAFLIEQNQRALECVDALDSNSIQAKSLRYDIECRNQAIKGIESAIAQLKKTSPHIYLQTSQKLRIRL